MKACVYINLIMLLWYTTSITGLDFQRTVTGVRFSPYIFPKEERNYMAYSATEIRTMLELTSTKFTRVSIKNAYAILDNHTITTAEIAAQINRDRNQTALSILIEIFTQCGIGSDLVLKEGLDSAKCANSIYPETVQGFVFTYYNRSNVSHWADCTLKNILTLKSGIKNLGFKVGTLQNCKAYQDLSDRNAVPEARLDILQHSDFVICDIILRNVDAYRGARNSFSVFAGFANLHRLVIHDINQNIQVMVHSYWPSDGGKPWQNIYEFRDYWKEVDQYASSKDFPMWIDGTFDVPDNREYGTHLQHLGWWRLVRNDSFPRKYGFKEKIDGVPLQKPKISSTTTAPLHYTAENNTDWLIYGIILITSVILMASIGVCYVNLHRKNNLTGPLSEHEIADFLNGRIAEILEAIPNDVFYENMINVSALRMPYDKSLEIPRGKLKILRRRVLGAGQYGIVYEALLKGGTARKVAAKTTTKGCSAMAIKSILSEIKILQTIGKHPNINSIIGAYTRKLSLGVVYFATEICLLGSLKSYLITSRLERRVQYQRLANMVAISNTVTFADLLRWSCEIANGMIHLGQKDIIHSDLSARNILLSVDRTAKISDFGLSRRLYDPVYIKRTADPLPWKWLAIESLEALQFSFSSDVWSYGITLWETFALGGQPFPNIASSTELATALRNGLQLERPQLSTSEVYELMSSCWKLECEERPQFSHIRDMLEIFLRHHNQ